MEPLMEWPSETVLGDRSQVLKWWESRRLRYNLYVGAVGAVSWLLVLIAGAAAVKPGVDFAEPLAMIFGPFVYAVAANICFSFGWVVDALFFARRPRIGLFKFGVTFSVVITAVPGMWAVIVWVMTLITGNKLD